MPHEKFDMANLEYLNDEARLESLSPTLMWEALGNPDPQLIVDVGAGTGLFACQFAELAPRADIYAVDIEPRAVRWMLQNRPAAACARLHPVLGAESAVPVATGEADLVVMINLHHELICPVDNYREAARVLRIGGQLLVVDWVPDADPAGPPQHIRSTAEQIAEVVSAVGFEEIALHAGLPRHSMITARKPAVCSL
jgi:SAM-dependent methyltransferase